MEQKLTFKELQSNIIRWAKDKNIHLPECAPKQRLKLFEEVGEFANAYLKNDRVATIDAIGDIGVVLIILAEQLEQNIDLDSSMFPFYTIEISLSDIIFCMSNNNINTSLYLLKQLAAELELSFEDCLNSAWNEIKDRKGKTVNGTFIKEN